MHRQILHGDVLEKLKEIEPESIDCIITSPPYWGLRDYGVDGQLGLESDFKQYLEKMAVIMEELKRVLKKTGSCWVNLGDTYSSNSSYCDKGRAGFSGKDSMLKHNQITEKSRFGIPERFYINCIDTGWIARNHIPWYKSNSMPSSVKDRFTNKWESIFFFVKSQKYYFNLDAVREKYTSGDRYKPFNIAVRDKMKGIAEIKWGKFKRQVSLTEASQYKRDGTKIRKQDQTLDASGKPNPTYKGFNERWKESQRKTLQYNGQSPHGIHKKREMGLANKSDEYNPQGKNPGDIFFINPKPFPESHFATFPVELPERILKCACPENGIVLDPFFGAGTVGVAAEKLNRQWIGIELKQEYIDIAQKRLDPYKNNKLENFIKEN